MWVWFRKDGANKLYGEKKKSELEIREYKEGFWRNFRPLTSTHYNLLFYQESILGVGKPKNGFKANCPDNLVFCSFNLEFRDRHRQNYYALNVFPLRQDIFFCAACYKQYSNWVGLQNSCTYLPCLRQKKQQHCFKGSSRLKIFIFFKIWAVEKWRRCVLKKTSLSFQ